MAQMEGIYRICLPLQDWHGWSPFVPRTAVLLEEARGSRGITHCNLSDVVRQQRKIDEVSADMPQALTTQARHSIRWDFASGLQPFTVLTCQ